MLKVFLGNFLSTLRSFDSVLVIMCAVCCQGWSARGPGGGQAVAGGLAVLHGQQAQLRGHQVRDWGHGVMIVT